MIWNPPVVRHLRRQVGAIAGLGAAMRATSGQLLFAPGAQAEPDDIFNVLDAITLGETFVNQAEDVFSTGSYAGGLETDLAVGNYLTLLPTEDVVLERISEQTRGYPAGGLSTFPDFPTDLSDSFNRRETASWAA